MPLVDNTVRIPMRAFAWEKTADSVIGSLWCFDRHVAIKSV